jgi:hypothetical protein
MAAGDALARGAKSAQFGGPNATPQIKWDWMWMSPRKFKKVYGVTKTQYEKFSAEAEAMVAAAAEKLAKRRKK